MVLNVTNHGKQARGEIVKATRLWIVKANEFNAQSYSSGSYGEPEKKKSRLGDFSDLRGKALLKDHSIWEQTLSRY